MHPAYLLMDPYLIWLYRITGHAFADFMLGTFLLAFIALVIGELTISVVFLIIKKRIDKVTDEVIRYQNLSMDAVQAGEKDAYNAANKLANDAFGKSFFMQIALSAAFLWPIPFALTWMQYRFGEVEFPILFSEHSLGFPAVFIALYAAAYLMFRRVKYKIPYFKRIKAILDSYDLRSRKIKTLADLNTSAGEQKVPGKQ
ncbi:MAG: hypothetical protein FJ118_11785 [Deltaproteobacteria bacterium]|nr:hypothetical protein [Deltaproteobacteria bacterium]